MIIAAALILLLIAVIIRKRFIRPAWKRAGDRGEQIAASVIRKVLWPGDIFLNNIEIETEGKKTELDNVVVNVCGVFIIEVKNYSGTLYGREEDYEWEKFKTTGGGNTYGKKVKNPLKQVRRQTYLLAKYLKQHHAQAWVEGYTYFVNNNCPVKCAAVLEKPEDIDRVIHNTDGRHLSLETIEKIERILTKK